MKNQQLIAAILASCVVTAVAAAAAEDAGSHALAREIFQQLIEIDTSIAGGRGSTPAAEAMAERFRAAGFAPADVQVVGADERKKNLVVRLHGSGKGGHKPVLLIGHLDIVDARREDWTTDPFKFTEQDGYFYGRGTQDMKDGAAIMVTTLLRLKRENYRPDRDIILALTADEESGDANGVEWLVKNRRDLIDAEFVLNHDGPGVILENGKAIRIELPASEKIYADYQLTVRNPGGHSSEPRPDNAIYALTAGLQRLAAYEFPFELNNVTRASYEQKAKVATGREAADLRAILQTPPDPAAIKRLSHEVSDNATVRTTCVATRLEGGHANNALPQMARATVNCRILPGHSAEEVRQTLLSVLADPQITIGYIDFKGVVQASAPSEKGYLPPPLRPEVLRPLERVAAVMWPGTPIIATMSPGASDGVYTSAAGLPTYGVSGDAIEHDDLRMHGRDERIGVQAFYKGVDFFYQYLKAVGSYR
jgi:acetylornithine deacetylase/succinyl-diaminopimelate desuccinylase-like protein